MSEAYAVSSKATIDQIHPMADMLLVRRLPDEEVTKSGLIIPEVARDRRTGHRIGVVLRVGRGDIVDRLFISGGLMDVDYAPMECRVGDHVLYMRCPDNDVRVDGVDCVLLREEQHVLAILEPAMPPVEYNGVD